MKLLLVILAAMFLLLQARLWFGDGGIKEVSHLKKEVKLQTAQVGHLKDRNVMLDAEVQDLKKRLGALEERARTDLAMVKEGEVFYQDAK